MDLNIIALAKTVKDKALAIAKKGLTEGVHEVDCTVHIKGSITVGEDTIVDAASGSVDYKNAFATVCGMLVKQCSLRGNPLSDELLKDLIGIAMRQGEIATDIADAMQEWIKVVERDCIQVTGKKTKKGMITTKLNYQFEDVEDVISDLSRVYVKNIG